jgi:hypothetical protein
VFSLIVHRAPSEMPPPRKLPPPCEMPPPKKRARKLCQIPEACPDTGHKLAQTVPEACPELSILERLIPEQKVFGLIFKSLMQSDKYNVICAEFNFSLQFGRWEERPEYRRTQAVLSPRPAQRADEEDGGVVLYKTHRVRSLCLRGTGDKHKLCVNCGKIVLMI